MATASDFASPGGKSERLYSETEIYGAVILLIEAIVEGRPTEIWGCSLL